jgi:hypothetical protein
VQNHQQNIKRYEATRLAHHSLNSPFSHASPSAVFSYQHPANTR